MKLNTLFLKKQLILIIIIWIASIILLTIYFNHKIDKLDFIEERRIVMTNNFSENADLVIKSTVRIIAETNLSQIPFTGGEYLADNNKVYSSGTGFIVDSTGYILTAEHVVKNTKNIVVIVLDGDKYVQTTAQFISSNSDADVALLKIDAKNLPYLKLGEYNKFKPGMTIGFVGFPLNFGFPMINQGIISSKTKFQYEPNRNSIQIYTLNAFVNHGNSGGPVFSADTGEVLGIINARINVVNENQFIKYDPKTRGASMSIGGVDPIALAVETYNLNLRLIGDVTQVGIGYSTAIDYGKLLLENAKDKK